MYTIEKMIIPLGKGIRAPKVLSGKTYNPLRLTPKGMVWHWTANTGRGADADNHITLWHRVDTGAHYVIDQDRIIQACPDNEAVWHAGPGTAYTSYIKKKYPAGANMSLIGVEMCVNSDGNWAETYKRAIYLGAVKCIEYGWDPEKNFERHYDCTGKDCPRMWTKYTTGGDAAWMKFKADVARLIKEMKTPYSGHFKDMQNHWAEGVVEGLYNAEITKGDGNGYFHPDEKTTRVEVAALTVRAATKLGVKFAGTPQKFKDVPHPECKWATDAINAASAIKLINGYQDGTFKPTSLIKRGEFAAIIANLFRVCGTSLSETGSIFNDTHNHWAKGDIAALTLLGIFSKDTNFYPNRELTRAELAAVIYRVLVFYGVIKPK